jgi:hypothetical protein
MSDLSAELLDVVPWPYGFAHSWAVRWLLEQEATSELVIGAVAGSPAPPHSHPVGFKVEAEHRLRGARADLSFELRQGEDPPLQIAFETKVNDPLKPEQLKRYIANGLTPLLFLPGSTGVLHRHDRMPREVWKLDGKALTTALADADDIPTIIASYLAAVASESMWFDRVIDDVAEGRLTPDPGQRQKTPVAVARATAWLSAIQGLIHDHYDDQGWKGTSSPRVTANDRGLMWDGAWRPADGANGSDSQMILEFIASVHTPRWSLNIKVYGAHGRAILRALPRAQTPPDSLRAWKPNRQTDKNGTVWSLDVGGLAPSDAVREAEIAADWMQGVAATAGAR